MGEGLHTIVNDGEFCAIVSYIAMKKNQLHHDMMHGSSNKFVGVRRVS